MHFSTDGFIIKTNFLHLLLHSKKLLNMFRFVSFSYTFISWCVHLFVHTSTAKCYQAPVSVVALLQTWMKMSENFLVSTATDEELAACLSDLLWTPLHSLNNKYMFTTYIHNHTNDLHTQVKESLGEHVDFILLL